MELFDIGYYWEFIKETRKDLSYPHEHSPLVLECRKALFEFECAVEAFRGRKPESKGPYELRDEMWHLREVIACLHQERIQQNCARLTFVLSMDKIAKETGLIETTRWFFENEQLTYMEVEDCLVDGFINLLHPLDEGREKYLRYVLRRYLHPDRRDLPQDE